MARLWAPLGCGMAAVVLGAHGASAITPSPPDVDLRPTAGTEEPTASPLLLADLGDLGWGEAACSQPAAEEEHLPISLSISYSLMSDYIFRGINYSEYYSFTTGGRGEGREKPNHQMTTSLDWNTGQYGVIGFDTFFEWYAAQKQVNPISGGQNLQEVDYIVRWTFPIQMISSDLTLGYAFLTFPNLAALLRTDRARGNNNDNSTHEWFFKLAHNDAWMWKAVFPENEEGVLNPTFFLAEDCGTGAGSVWMEFSISHPFKIPGVPDLTITPGWMLAIDGGYLKRQLNKQDPGHLRLAYQQLRLNVTYDLTSLLQLPRWAGGFSVSGLLYFNDALGTAEIDHGRGTGNANGEIQDEFWGGMSVTWAWGG